MPIRVTLNGCILAPPATAGHVWRGRSWLGQPCHPVCRAVPSAPFSPIILPAVRSQKKTACEGCGLGSLRKLRLGTGWPVSQPDTLRAGKKGQLVDGTGCERADWSTQGRPQCQRAIAPQAHPKRANRSLHGLTTPAVRPTRPLMGWTPRPKPCGTPPKIRHLVPRRTISRKRRSLTGLVSRRKSE